MPATANGKPLIAARINERRTGAWTAHGVEVDTDDAIEGAITIDIDGEQWVGTVWRGEQDTGRFRCTVVGGAGGLREPVPALWYDSGVSLRTPIADILRVGGETLSNASDAAVTGKLIPRWHRSQGCVAELLAGVREKSPAGTVWRVLRDGDVWFGVDTYPGEPVRDDDEIHDPDPSDDLIEIWPETPYVRPGVTYNGLQVAEVETRLDGPKLTQILHGPKDTQEAHIDSRIRRFLTYRGVYTATVRAQSGSNVDVMPDDPIVAGRGLTGVPMRHGLPGVTVSLAIGSKVLLGFEGADPSAPYVSLWPDGSSVSSVTFAGDLHVAGDVTVGGNVDVSGDVAAVGDVDALNVTASVEVTAGITTLTKHVHNVPPPVGAPTAPGLG